MSTEQRQDSEIAVAPGKGGGWNARVVDASGAPLLDGDLGGRIGLRSVLRVAWAYLRRTPIGGVVVENPAFGNVSVGQGPNGYAQPWREAPGGAVIIPYVVDTDRRQVYVGLLSVKRGLVGGGDAVEEIPRGFVNTADGESHAEGARRETLEETGVSERLADRVVELPGIVNADSAFFRTDPAAGEGVRMFALPIRADEIEFSAEDGTGRLIAGLFDGVREVNEKINPAGLRFVPIDRAMTTGDNFTRGAAGALWGHLSARRQVTVTGPVATADGLGAA